MLPRKRQERCPEEVLREHAIMGGRRGWQLLAGMRERSHPRRDRIDGSGTATICASSDVRH